MVRQVLLPLGGGVAGGALTVLVLWLAGLIWQSEQPEAGPEPVLSAIEAIAVVHQVRGDGGDGVDDGAGPMHEVLRDLCYPEEPDWRAVYLYGKWEITARCSALLESPVWFVTDPDLNVVPYTNAAGRLTQ